MDDYSTWLSNKDQIARNYQIERLQVARKKLIPIIDYVIASAVDIIQKDEHINHKKHFLTPEQCSDVIIARAILREIVCPPRFRSHKSYELANANIIINNVCVDTRSNQIIQVQDKPMIIDEARMLELLELYEKMGVVIQKLMSESVKVNDCGKENLSSSRANSSCCCTKQPSSTVTTNKTKSTTKQESLECTCQYSEDSKINSKLKHSSSGAKSEKEPSSTIIAKSPPQPESSECACKISYDSTSFQNNEADENQILIKIQYYSDEDQNGSGVTLKKGSSTVKVNLGDDPLTLKVHESDVEDGAIYCINTGDSDEKDIRIVIKKCSDCMTSVNSAPTEKKSTTTYYSETPPDTTEYDTDISSEYQDECKCGESKSQLKTSSSPKTTKSREDKTVAKKDSDDECKCDGGSDITPSQIRIRISTSAKSETRMDVIIDTDNVAESKVKVRDGKANNKNNFFKTIPDDKPEPKPVRQPEPVKESEPEPVKDSEPEPVRKPEPARKPEPVSLTRKRVCSSMEFDVEKTETRLRESKIENQNNKIVLELENLGVDKILRASRPAKCCRKAILNERQKTALPYSVSLKSLPLIDTDIKIIQDSLAISLKKKNKAADISSADKDKLAYYVSLGKYDFQPNINFPWVAPVFDIKVNHSKIQNKLYMLKKRILNPKLASISRLLETIKSDRRNERTRKINLRHCRYVLKPGRSEQVLKYKIHKSKTKRIRFLSDSNLSDRTKQNSLMTIKNFQILNATKPSCHKEWHNLFSEKSDSKKMDLYTHKDQSSIISNLDDQKCRNNLDHSISTFFQKGDGLAPSCNKNLDIPIKPLCLEIKNKPSRPNLDQTKTVARKTKRCLSMPSLMDENSRSTKTIHNFRSHCSLRKLNQVIIPKDSTKLEDISWEYTTKKQSLPEKKLEYFVDLVDGDLVWSSSVALAPITYDTYYYSNTEPVRDPMSSLHVTKEESQRGIPTNLDPSQRRRSGSNRRSTLSDLTPLREQKVPTQLSIFMSESNQTPSVEQFLMPSPNTPIVVEEKSVFLTTPIPPSEFDEFHLGPENAYHSWAPLLASVTSLPNVDDESSNQRQIKAAQEAARQQKNAPVNSEVEEEALTQRKGAPVEEQAVSPRKGVSVEEQAVTPRKEVSVEEQAVTPRKEVAVEQQALTQQKGVEEQAPVDPKKKCSGKQICVKQKCSDCKEKPCTKHKDSKSTQGQITIAIIKARDQDGVGSSEPTPCTKDICEIYRNENIGTSKSRNKKKADESQHHKRPKKDNIEIYVNDKKLCFDDCNKSK